MTRDEIRRAEIAEMFAECSPSFDDVERAMQETRAMSLMRLRMGWNRLRKTTKPLTLRVPRVRKTREQKLAMKAAWARASYQALTPEQRRERNAKMYEAIKSNEDALERRRKYGRDWMAAKRAAGLDPYRLMTDDEKRARNAAEYQRKISTPERLEKKRAENREWMRKRRAALKAGR